MYQVVGTFITNWLGTIAIVITVISVVVSFTRFARYRRNYPEQEVNVEKVTVKVVFDTVHVPPDDFYVIEKEFIGDSHWTWWDSKPCFWTVTASSLAKDFINDKRPIRVSPGVFIPRSRVRTYLMSKPEECIVISERPS